MYYREMELALNYYKDKYNAEDISMLLDINIYVVRRWLKNIKKLEATVKKQKMKFSILSKELGELDNFNEDIAAKMIRLRNIGYSLNKIAKLIDGDDQNISDIILRYEINELKKYHPTLDNKSISEKTEIAIKLRKEGYSIRDIAKQVLSMRVAREVCKKTKISKKIKKVITKTGFAKIRKGISEIADIKRNYVNVNENVDINDKDFKEGIELIFKGKKYEKDIKTLDINFLTFKDARKYIEFLERFYKLKDSNIKFTLYVYTKNVKKIINYWTKGLGINRDSITIVHVMPNQFQEFNNGKLHIYVNDRYGNILKSVKNIINNYDYKNDNIIVSMEKLAEMFNVTKQSIYNMTKDGCIRYNHSNIGAYLYYNKKEVLQDIKLYDKKRKEWKMVAK